MSEGPDRGHQATGRRRQVACVPGSKYTLEAVYLPVCEQLSKFADVHLYVLDFPESYDVSALLDRKRSEGALAAYTMMPSPSRAVRHHRALHHIADALGRQQLDMLILAGDFMPMHRYFIDAARAKRAPIIGLESGAPTKLLASYRAENKAGARGPATRANLGSHKASILLKVPRWAVARLEWIRRYVFQYKVLPFFFAGRTFDLESYERSGRILFATVRVDSVIVLSETVRRAMRHFFPEVDVRHAEHPMASRCRCDDLKGRPTKLLVTLGAPWHYYIEHENSAQDIEDRWCHAIFEAQAIGGFSQVAIRPHPRETDPYPRKLVERLGQDGLHAVLLDPKESSLPDIVCDYSGVLGAPSGALAEAATACRRGFVIGLDQIQGSIGDPSAGLYGSEIVEVGVGEDLQRAHFRERSGQEGSQRSVLEHLLDLTVWSVQSEAALREGRVLAKP